MSNGEPLFPSKLPSVLYRPNGNSLSIERVLKQAIKLLEGFDDKRFEDELSTCIEDLETLLKCLDRG